MQVVPQGAAISTVNLTEVVAGQIDGRLSVTDARHRLSSLTLEIVPRDEALAGQMGVPALTADRSWATLNLATAVEVLR